jgi:hypothetical protein
MRKLGTEQNDLRRIVDSDEQDHDRPRSAVGRLEPLSVSGNHLKSMANNAVRIASEARKLIASHPLSWGGTRKWAAPLHGGWPSPRFD